MKNATLVKKLCLLVCIAFTVSIMMFGLTACGTDTAKTADAPKADAAPKAEAPKADAKKIVIGYSQCTINHPWRVAQVEGSKKWAKENAPDTELIVTDGQNNATKQVSDVEDLIARKVDVLMIAPLTEDALTPVVKKALDAGIKVVTLDRKVNVPVTCHVGADNLPIGILVADFLNEKLGGKGNIIEIQGTAGASATNDRHSGFMEQLKKYPGFKVVGTQNCDYLREPAMKYMEDMLQKFGPGQIQAVYAHNDEEALGAVKALEAANRLKEVAVVGVDGEELAIEAIKDGKMQFTVTYPYCAPEGIQTAYKIAKGEKLPELIKLENKPISAKNLNDWLGKGF